jgi:3-dehydroquinate synthase
MATIKSTSYSIYIGEKSLPTLVKFLTKNSYTNYFIICDEHTFEYCLPNLLFNVPKLHEAEIIELESGEDKKTLETCLQVWGALTDAGADKKSLLINLGGGVISDLGGFVASTFKRGIHFINIPTTLLSMVDASVGGGVFVNPEFLKTLSERQIKNGFAEVIKIALIADKEFWKELKKLKSAKEFYSEKIITKAIELKNTIVKKDVYENDLRKSLNFGHNIGHALESALIEQKKDILHGEAVAAGMLMEADIAYTLKRINVKELKEISDYINFIYSKIKLSNSTKELLLKFILHDKKNEGEALCFSLPKNIGYFELYNGVKIELIKNALVNY